ncbi:hypothetical protein [Streptomyces sp. XD-27]|uniref:hypothetical protein n=1 Tax=Streptomyces sp. XD-27 TaxID=3062779 RepID=UPI0026F429E9|nr:hypothetical protein [Streptomyces sp. XD-27]WKX70951.1 hypothetical protein Q3Y56_14480 [Streptomyces sp. XD-27]
MARRPLLTAAALAASAALLLTACGGGSDGKKSDKIEGAEGGGIKSPSPSKSPESDPMASKRPKLKGEKGFTTVFEGWTSDDPKENAVLLDGKYQALAVNSAIFKQDPEAPEVGFYNIGPALASAREWVTGFKKNGDTLTGTLRYYDPRIKFTSDDVATLRYCTDESKAFSKDIKTDKIDRTEPSSKSYVLYVTGVVKNSEGIWQTTSLVSQRGKCQP